MGCGGGGRGSSIAGRAATVPTSVLITDAFNDNYTQVWATIYQVTAIPQGGGTPVVLFSSTTGDSVDLASLHDASGQRFSFLGTAGIPAGTYTGLTITVGPTMQLFAVGSTTATTVPVATTLPVNSSGDPVLTLTFKAPKTVTTTTSSFVVDFNLANFVIKNSQVLPSVQDSDGPGMTDPARQNLTQITGVVSALSGSIPTLSFTLTPTNGTAQTVVTTAASAVYGASLANGSNAVVFGTLDTTTQNFVATRIQVLPVGAPAPGAGPNKTQVASGAASAINATAGTFTVAVKQSCGFAPTATSVNVVTTSTTTYYADNGSSLTSSVFFTDIATTPNVAIQGTYDSTTNTITATSISISNHSNDGGWENGPNNFRPGTDLNNWGNGSVKGH